MLSYAADLTLHRHSPSLLLAGILQVKNLTDHLHFILKVDVNRILPGFSEKAEMMVSELRTTPRILLLDVVRMPGPSQIIELSATLEEKKLSRMYEWRLSTSAIHTSAIDVNLNVSWCPDHKSSSQSLTMNQQTSQPAPSENAASEGRLQTLESLQIIDQRRKTTKLTTGMHLLGYICVKRIYPFLRQRRIRKRIHTFPKTSRVEAKASKEKRISEVRCDEFFRQFYYIVFPARLIPSRK